MLQLNDIELRRGVKLLLEHASLQVHAGQRMGLIGVNGSGKSSLFCLLLGQLESDAGSLQINPKDVIGHVAQESPSTDKPAIEFVQDGDQVLREVQAQIRELESADNHDARLPSLYEQMDTIDGFTAETRAARLLHGLGFAAEDVRKPVNEFSGGWRMRLNLAQALMCRSDILLLDEPTNHLDLPTILWLERWLKSYTGILLLISHDRDFLDDICTHIAHIEHETIKSYTGNYSQFEDVRSEQLALQQAMHIKQQREIKHIQSFVDKFRYKASKAKQAQSRIKMLERMSHIAAAHVDSHFQFQFEVPDKQPQHLQQLEDVSVGYGEQVIVDEIQLRIGAGDRIGLLGSNGAGKSTLVKTLVDGSTLLGGERTLNKYTEIGYFAQHQLELLRMDCSPLWHLQQQHPNAREQDLRNRLGHFGFRGERIDEKVAPFSGGEKARLVLALLVMQKPNLLLLDEPTNHLDLDMRQALSMALVEYSGALLVISHDRHLLRSVCDSLYVVHDGQLHAFDESIDDYPNWLKLQDAEVSENEESGTSVPPSASKKQNRQQEAAKRKALKPFSDKVRSIEKAMNQRKSALAGIETSLHDEALYSDASRKQEMKKLLQKQAELKSELDDFEWQWLESSETLEKAEQEL